jgi:hypothetical protein
MWADPTRATDNGIPRPVTEWQLVSLNIAYLVVSRTLGLISSVRISYTEPRY